MRDSRDMFYSDYQAGGFVNPMNNVAYANTNMMPNVNAYSMQGFNSGPSAAFIPTNNMNNQAYFDNSNYMDNRVLKLERQVKRLESRVTRLENLSGNSLTDDLSSTDMYMI